MKITVKSQKAKWILIRARDQKIFKKCQNLEKFIEKTVSFIFKKLILIDLNIENILGSNKYDIWEECFKSFIGCVNKLDDKLKPLLIKLSKLSGSVTVHYQ